MCVVVAVVALMPTANASASGPQTGALQGGPGVSSRDGKVRYVVLPDGANSVVEALQTNGGRVSSFYSLNGIWGIPTVTLRGQTDGLSRDGQFLVLADASAPSPLRSHSTFFLLSTTPVAPEQVVDLKGDFAFDALSPDNRTLYLIQHVSANVTSYRVRAYDLTQNRLLPGAIADKRQAGWTMNGYPVARAATPDGRWVYTLYRNDGGYPFVHALDSAHRSAVCIGVPWQQGASQDALARASLRLDARKLTIAVAKHARFVLDTHTFAMTKAQRRGSEAILPGAAAAALLFLLCAGFAARRRLRTDR